MSCATPKGAFYAFPNIKRTGWKAKPLASALLEDAGVALIGGPDFGVLGEGYVRVSYANSTENIVRALDRIGEFLAPQGGVTHSGAERSDLPLRGNPESQRKMYRFVLYPFCVSRKPTTTTTSPTSCDTLGTSPSARNPINSMNGGTSEGNKTAREAPSSTTARVNRYVRAGAGQPALDHGLQHILRKPRGKQDCRT